MTIRDLRSIHSLYFFQRYTPASLARLYGLSHQRVLQILSNKKGVSSTVITEVDCQVCGADESQTYYIDGNKTNNKPQNLIMLCEPDKRKFQHLQLRRRKGLLMPQMETMPQL
jgi:hypothetical protein